MRFELTETQRDIQKAAREFAGKEFDLDLALELEKERKFPNSLFEKASRLGFIGMNYPEEFGGQSLGLFEQILVIEEFTKKDSGIGISLSLADMGSSVILRHGDEKQKKKYLAPVAQGKTISAAAVIGPRDPADRAPVFEKAAAEGDGYLVRQGKAWVTLGSLAGFLVVLSEGSHPEKPIALVVEKNREGVGVSGLKKVMGLRISPISEMTFDQVKVPGDQVILCQDEKTDPLKTYRQVHRIKTSAQALGIAQGAFDQAVKHAKEREQFGRKIIQFQGIQFMLADLYTQIEAARGLVYRAAVDYDAGARELERISSVAKLFATDVAVKTAIDSIQIHGGVGLMREYSIERMLRDAKTIQNLGETNLIQRAFIGERIAL